MAKSRRKKLSSAAALVRSAGGRVVHKHKGPIMVAGSKVGKVGDMASAKKASKAALGKALDEAHTMSAVGASAALGYLVGSGNMPEIPTVGGLSPEAMLGIGSWVGAKYTKSKTLEHLSTGLLAVAAYQMAKDAAGGEDAKPASSGWDEDEY